MEPPFKLIGEQWNVVVAVRHARDGVGTGTLLAADDDAGVVRPTQESRGALHPMSKIGDFLKAGCEVCSDP